ncbi:GerAB/ArcD/ProY family transporter [Fictibacillus sp. Mic-4]|uniref:GerAB/ArcD/ProY family transporter n=1 Tax=Fictibacillus sp. Mic-4 TaxID=3132826 RepID=UPI003CF8FCA4
MKTSVKEAALVSPFLTLFLIHAIQVGIGMLRFQRFLTKTAGNDAVFTIIIYGIIVHITIFLIYQILEKHNGADLIEIHKALLGKWAGGLISILYMAYFLLLSFTVIRSYIEIIQVWIFPELKTWWLAIIFVIIIYYVVSGGFRVVTGVCFFGVIIPFFLIICLAFPLRFAHFNNLLPLFNYSIKDILTPIKQTGLTFAGFETLLMFYPFIKKREKSQKWAQLGALMSTLIYLFVMTVSIVFFSQQQLAKTIWATLTMTTMVQLPFIERFEYAAIATYLIVIMPNVCLAIWVITRGCKQLFSVRQDKALIVLCVLTFILTCTMERREMINNISTISSYVAFFVTFVYIPLLFILTMIKKRKRLSASTLK